MDILIENDDTLEYLTSTGEWTKDPRNARHFPKTQTAWEAARQEVIGKFNIVCHIAQTNQFINLNHGRGKASPAEGV